MLSQNGALVKVIFYKFRISGVLFTIAFMIVYKIFTSKQIVNFAAML